MPAKAGTTITLAIAAILITAGGCLRPGAPVENTGPEAFVSVAPLAFFARRIAGRHVAVRVLIKPGANPHTYVVTPKHIVRLNRGGLLLCGGSGFEKSITSRLAPGNGKLRIVNVAKGLENESHDHQGHRHGGEDQHVWMSPRIAKTLASAICGELCLLDPPHADEFQANLQTLLGDLDDLDAKLTKTLAPLKGRTFFVFHPAFGHLAGAYGLKQEAVETQGKSPGPKHITELIERARSAGVKTIFAQPQFSKRAAEIIADRIGGKVVLLDPLSPDYITNIQQIAEELLKALQP